MRTLLGSLALVIVSNASALEVHGIPVRGSVHSVSVVDIGDAIKAVHGDVSKITVLSADRMRVFLKPTDLGWITVRRDPYAKDWTARGWPGWLCDGRGVDDPEISQFMHTAGELYVFPVLTPLKPHRDDKHMRRLDDPAKRGLVRLLTDRRSWYHGAYTMIITEPEPKNIGILFRQSRTELVLFFSGSFTSSAGLIHGAFNGQHVEDMLEDDAGKKMEQWSRRFAQPEHPPPKRSNQAMQRTAPRFVSPLCVATTFNSQPRPLPGAVAEL